MPFSKIKYKKQATRYPNQELSNMLKNPLTDKIQFH